MYYYYYYIASKLFIFFNIYIYIYIYIYIIFFSYIKAVCCRGTVDEKIHFMFNMYDVSHGGSVSKQELETLLNHVPKYVLREGTGFNRSQVLS